MCLDLAIIYHMMQLATAEQKTAIFGVLGQVHISDATEEDLKTGKEEIKVNQSIVRLLAGSQ